MDADLLNEYEIFRQSSCGFYEQKRGLIKVSGIEAVQFLNGLITNDAAKLQNGSQMRAAFPNAQGRLLALVRVVRRDDGFLFETEAATREKVFQNLFRFTFAGDFFVEDLSDDYVYLEVHSPQPTANNLKNEAKVFDSIVFQSQNGADFFVPKAAAESCRNKLKEIGAVEFSGALYEILRLENGVPLYGIDADETTIVPELGIEDLISYKKGCYIGQEIIARIHFRGHIAKQLTGLILSGELDSELQNAELKSLDGKNAGKITSIAFSPTLGKYIALALVRYDYLADGTTLKISETSTAQVKDLPFIR